MTKAAKHRRILVVDDEPHVVSLIETLLHSAGYQVHTAGDGLEALEFYREHPGIDLVVLDLAMPHMTGQELLRELRAVNPDVKVVVCSGFITGEVETLLRLGVAAVLAKPFRPDQLLHIIQRIFDDSAT